MSQNSIPTLTDSGNREYISSIGGVNPATSGNVNYDKYILSTQLLLIGTGATPGYEFNIGEASEVAIFSDVPIDIGLDRSGNYFTSRTDLRLRGRIRKLYFRVDGGKWAIKPPGRVVVYVGRPYLGTSFERETFRDKVAYREDLTLINWAGGAGSAALVTLPGLIANWREAGYIRSVYLSRSTGVIDRITFTESESGASRLLFEIPGDGSGVLSYSPPIPIRIPCAGTVHAYGNIVAGATTVDGGFMVTPI